ncbi:hypothetical protein MMC11_004728 [Xylographa trunciseda]|nr:hypothetical protein [Xylographa trunciseda]
MTRKTKFNFLSIYRGSNSEKNERPTTNQRTPTSSPSSPAWGSVSKAEELLGPSETGGGTHQFDGLGRCHTGQRLRKKCSALSITIAECRFNTSRAHKRAGDAERTKVYSPAHGPADNISVTSSTSRSIHKKRSTSTIDSHHDPAVSPVAVPQQTSASAARDMALRKGCPPVLSPLRFTTFQDSAEKPRPKKHIPKKQAEITQRRITHVDLSSLLPQSQLSERQLDSHLKIETSTSVMVVDSENHSARPLPLRSWTGQKVIKITSQPGTTAEGRKEDIQADEDERSGALPLTSQFLPPVKDVENWLDDAELDDKFDTMGEQTTLQMFIRGDRSSLNSSHDSIDQSSSSVRTMTSQVSPAKPQSQSKPSDRETPLPEKTNTAAITRHGTQLTRSDLQLESVLALSSSDDSETEVQPRTKGRRNSRPKRLMVSTKSHHPPKPSTTQKPSENNPNQHTTTPPPQHPVSPEHSPTLPRTYGQPLDQHSTPAYWPPDMIRNPHPLHPSSQLSPTRKKPSTATPTDLPHPPSTPLSPSHLPDESPHSRLSRMMAVSPEEEKLLSAMRHKRASMRKEPLPLPAPTARPRTADTDRPPSSFFEPDMTLFPKPPRHPLRRLSSDDLRLRGLDGYRSDDDDDDDDADAASAGSLPSRLIPSPALSQEEAPLTPASAGFVDGVEGWEDGEEERYDEFGSEGQVKARAGRGQGHVRKRTVSSVLCLDGVEERARQREEEEDLAMWGAGRCI